MFTGYCVELMKELAGHINEDYRLQIVKDGQYGSKNKINGTWNGMIGELVNEVRAGGRYLEWHDRRIGE
jgi:hypothetical protein